MPHPAASVLSIGSKFENRYEIVADLGSGSFGRVYKARQLSTGQPVALKVLRERDEGDASVENQVRRFEREMRLCSALSHPNVVRIIDSGRAEGGSLYAVFEYVPGATLADVLAEEGALGMRETLHLMTQVLDALACAHRSGIVHRDLKPSNIMVSHTGARRNALVLDFGLGAFIGDAAEPSTRALTASGEFMGTPLYAAPEQLEGRRATERSDLYSWGLIFIECLLGHHVFEGDAGAGIVRIAGGSESVVLPEWLRGHRLGRLLDTVTASDPGERNITVESLLRTLDLAIWGEQRSATGYDETDAMPVGERRQLTIVSCRIVLGSRAEDLDLEERDVLLREQHAACAEIAHRWGGQVASKMGDRILLHFGYPQTREDDVRRAARAAREIVAAVARRSAELEGTRGAGVEVSIGIHSGLVITRDIPGATRRGAIDVVGATPEVATDLDGMADPGDVLLSPETRRLLRDEPTERLGERRLPGASTAVPLYRLAPVSAAGEEERTIEGAFVGRSGEVHQLLEARAQAESGTPRCVLVSGEAGIGKSRLVRELRRKAEGTLWLECRCLPENQDAPLRPIIDLLTTLDEPLDSFVARCGLDADSTVPLLRALLGGPAPEPPLALTRERQSELTLEALIALLLGLARDEAVGLVIEDLHWADPTSLELLNRLSRELHAARLTDAESAPRLLAIFTARLEFAPAWSDVTRLQLARLSPAEVGQMIASGLAPEQEIPADALALVVQRSDGVPLFVEEMARVLFDRAATRSRGEPESGEPIEIPSTLRSLLGERLDALSPDARETAQLAAAVGREFEAALLGLVSPKDSPTLMADLSELVSNELVLPRKARGGVSYVFKHALVRDAAYESMLRPVRRHWHERIANALAEQFPAQVEQRPELLAWHLEGAEDHAQAIDWRKRAGDRATVRGAYLEAIRHFEKGMSLLARLSLGRERTRRQLALTESLGTALFSTRGYAAPEVRETFTRARSLCRDLGEEVPFRVLWGLWAAQITGAEERGTAELIPHFVRLADADPHPVHLLGAHSAIATRALYQGDFERALDESRLALTWYAKPEFQSFAREYGYDIGIYSIAYEMVAQMWLGYPDRAREACARMMSAAEESGNPYSLAIARGHEMNLYRELGDLDATIASTDRQIASATEQRIYLWIAPAMCTRGWALAQRGELAQGTAQIQQGLALCRAAGFRICEGFHLAGLAEAQTMVGDLDSASATIEAGLAHCAATVDRFYEPELLRLRGEIARLRGEPEPALLDFHAGLELTRRYKGKTGELRIACSLGSLLASRGETGEARTMLREAHDWFDAGADSGDLRRARELLAQLA